MSRKSAADSENTANYVQREVFPRDTKNDARCAETRVLLQWFVTHEVIDQSFFVVSGTTITTQLRLDTFIMAFFSPGNNIC